MKLGRAPVSGHRGALLHHRTWCLVLFIFYSLVESL
jgi:hypothetical protein